MNRADAIAAVLCWTWPLPILAAACGHFAPMAAWLAGWAVLLLTTEKRA